MLANVQTHRSYHFSVRNIAICAMLSAVASVLMFISFSVPLMPSFIKLDLSELPALLAAFTLGPVEGIIVCLVKNLVNLFFTTTAGVGELCNFLMGAAMMIPAGLIYKKMQNRAGAVLGAVAGAVPAAGTGSCAMGAAGRRRNNQALTTAENFIENGQGSNSSLSVFR